MTRGTILDSSSYLGNPAPFNKTILPQGTYTHGNSIAMQIEVTIYKKDPVTGVFNLMQNPIRYASTGQAPNGTLTWSAAAYQNLVTGDYMVRTMLYEGYVVKPMVYSFTSQADALVAVP